MLSAAPRTGRVASAHSQAARVGYQEWERPRVAEGLPSVSTAIDIPSPCIGVCRLDPVSHLCEGCLRTTQEIARWPYADVPERHEILQRLRERRRAAGRTSEADSRPRRRALVGVV
jgi:predicted Fe-S protein YdhL (DUF1289 family)